jgi:site-specific DNA recombinase
MSRTPTCSYPVARPVRCAIYTRKSTDEGLDQEFNSLDAQREAAQAYIQSQAAEGWLCLPTRYDDGGFSGATLERPALKRLLADIQAGLIDTVLVYKVDRLSRSLLGFAKMMETFDQHGVGFVSVTQHFNSTQPMGRLTLHILLSFAQFEREIISERTRDKMAAARRKGKWAGGAPALGYDLDPVRKRLVVNAEEAARVRALFALYLEHQALLPVVEELARRGWLTKCWRTRQGQRRGGRPFTKTSLHELLTNVLYIGQVRYRDEVHAGEQPALVEATTFQRVQALLTAQGRTGGRLRGHALLAGLLFCRPCGCAMTPAHASKGSRRYRYYVCTKAQKQGWRTCPSKAVPAAAIEGFVLDQMHDVSRAQPAWSDLDVAALRQATPLEQARLVHHLVARVQYDGAQGNVAITFRAPEALGSPNGEPHR